MPEQSLEQEEINKMPNVLSKEKAQSIASEYCTNKHQKVLALLTVGYSVNYANNVGLKLFDNDKVKQAISRIQANLVAKTGRTAEQLDKMYEDAYDLGYTCKQPSAMVSAVTGIARLYGMERGNDGGEKTIIVISPQLPDSPIKRKLIDSKEISNGM